MPWGTIISIAFSIFKFGAGKVAAKKLSDKEFVEFILAYQDQKSNAGQAALDSEASIEEGMAQLDREELLAALEEEKRHQEAGEGPEPAVMPKSLEELQNGQ